MKTSSKKQINLNIDDSDLNTQDFIFKKLEALFNEKVAQEQVMGKTKELYPKIIL